MFAPARGSRSPRRLLTLALAALLAACGEPAATPTDGSNVAGEDAGPSLLDAGAAPDGGEVPGSDADLAGEDASFPADAGAPLDASASAPDAQIEPGPDAATASPDADVPAGPDASITPPDASIPPADAGPFLVRGASASFHVTSTVTVQNSNATLTRLSVEMPAPQTNVYQDVANLVAAPGTVKAIPQTDDFYALFTQTSNLPKAGQSIAWSISYDVTLYDLHVDLSQVTTVLPYDTGSNEYLWYTGASGDLVVPTNATIQSISTTLWNAHPDVLGYVRAAYEYVAANYSYLNPYTGLHPLADLLAAGGGDCGNLSSIFVSLVRARGIPARHLVTIRPDGSYHVWADFLLQGYGWVPVDVTFKQSNPGGDYFGKVALGSNGIIMDKEVDLTLDNGGGTHQLPMLQNFAWWFWSSTPSPSVTPSYQFSASPK